MNGTEVLENLLNENLIYRGYFETECDNWFIKYNKNNKSFEFGSGWNEALKYKSNQEILNFIFYTLMFDHWQKKL